MPRVSTYIRFPAMPKDSYITHVTSHLFIISICPTNFSAFSLFTMSASNCFIVVFALSNSFARLSLSTSTAWSETKQTTEKQSPISEMEMKRQIDGT